MVCVCIYHAVQQCIIFYLDKQIALQTSIKQKDELENRCEALTNRVKQLEQSLNGTTFTYYIRSTSV